MKTRRLPLLPSALAAVSCTLASSQMLAGSLYSFSRQTLDNPAAPTFNHLLGSGSNVDQGGALTSVSNPNFRAGVADVTQLLGVNNLGIAAGFYADAAGNGQGFIYNIAAGTFTSVTLPPSYGAVTTVVTGVSDSGVIIGFYVDAASNTHGFLYNDGTFTSFDDPSGTSINTTLRGPNDLGVVVGSYLDAVGVTKGLVYDYVTIFYGFSRRANTQYPIQRGPGLPAPDHGYLSQ